LRTRTTAPSSPIPAGISRTTENELVILDEVHRVPELFQQLRGIIDRGRRHGKANGRFLLLGSAAMDLLKQSGESLAGRISYLELAPSMLWRSIRLR